MKNIFIYALLAFCFSCAFSESIVNIKTSDPAKWQISGDVHFSDTGIILEPNAIVGLSDSYKNFDLSFECKTGIDAIGAVYFHTQKMNLNTGYEVMINNNIEPNEWRKTGGLTAVRNFGKRTADNGEWVPVKIMVVDKQIKTYVNNLMIVDYTEPDDPYRESNYGQRILSKGNILFSCKAGTSIAFRNMKIRRLPNDTVNMSFARNEQKDDIIRLQQQNFPTIDYHVHAKGGLTTGRARAMARTNGVTYAVAPNCGLDFPIKNDGQLLAWLAENKFSPFLVPMQAEGREWPEMFSREAISKFDYVFTDALTWSDRKGRRMRLWIPEDTFIDDEQEFMDMLTEVTCKILATEPINILANPTYLPEALMADYDKLWTEERMIRMIDAAIEHNIALELNNLNRIPSYQFIKLAKQKGVKFTFGTNNANEEQLKKMEYLIDVIKECGLTVADMYIPISKNF